MTHLSASEFVDLADGTLAPHRAAHVDRCDACRAQAAAVHDALRLTGSTGPVPEPSPMFWDHLSARVREAIDAPPPRSRFGFGFLGVRPGAAFAALAVVVILGAMVVPGLRRAGTPGPPSSPSAAIDQASDPALDPAHAAAWSVLTAAAEDLRLEEARDAGMAVPPAAVDRAVNELSRAELSELGRLLQSELKRSSN
jgi:hypothetical protein